LSKQKYVLIHANDSQLRPLFENNPLTTAEIQTFTELPLSSQALVIAELEGRHEDVGPEAVVGFAALSLPIYFAVLFGVGFAPFNFWDGVGFAALLLATAGVFAWSLIAKTRSRGAAAKLAAFRAVGCSGS
jgi:hypothetical protein